MIQLALLSLLPALAHAALSIPFTPAAPCPTCTSDNYVGRSNGSLPVAPIVPGLVYDRFISIWLENIDYSAAAADPNFQAIAKQGILLTNYNGVTHPSEPNYLASVAGDYFGMGDDAFYAIPANVSSMADLLEAKNVSWASYQENMPTDGYSMDFASPNYVNSSAPAYTYYKRKHNPDVLLNSVASNPYRALRIRNFNDFAVDVNASALPQHVRITPNMINDGHDTTVTYTGSWVNWWLNPLLKNPNFNSERTLIHLTFDENESYDIQNTVYTVLLGNAVPSELKGTNDSTFYTHYSMMSSVQNNWGLQNLGRQDTNKTVSNVFAFQADKTNYTNLKLSAEQQPNLNLTGIFPGVANTEMWTPIPAPNISAVGAGQGKTMYNASLDTSATMDKFAVLNLTAMKVSNPVMVNPNYTYAGYSVVNASSPAALAATSSAASPSSTGQSTTAKSSADRLALGGSSVLIMAIGAVVALA